MRAFAVFPCNRSELRIPFVVKFICCYNSLSVDVISSFYA